MSLQTILYFTSILLTCALTGFLAWYAWKHEQVPASRAYMRLTLSECLFALAEIFSVLSPSSTAALFWFQVRYLAGAFMGIFWFVFALEYSGYREWFSKRLLAGLFVIPFVTQVMLWSNSLHDLWMKQEAVFYRNGPLWIADVTTRIPGLGYLTHSFYTLILTLAGIALMFLTAWKMRRELLMQALMLAGAGLTAFTFAMNSLFNFLPKTEFNPFTPGIGLSVLLIALSVFRFEFLKRDPPQENAARMTSLEPQEKRSLAVFIFVFILLVSGLAAVSTLTYQNYQKQFRAQVDSQLGAIASLKADQLQDWRDERLADASLFYRNENFSERVRNYLEDPQDAEVQAKLLTWLEKIKASPKYDRVFLLDTQGVERISLPSTPEALPAELVEQAFASLASGQIVFLDFHRHSESDVVHLSMLVPIYDAQNNQPLGVLVLRINPYNYLYPFIQRWPVPSESGETLLARRDGDNLLFLNSLRFQSDAALNLRFPLDKTELPAVKAVLGQTGIVEGLDYRNVLVNADIRAVPDSPWFLVSKMDTAEAYAPLRAHLWQTILFFGALILATGAGLILVWHQQRVLYYRAQAETTDALRVSEEKFRLAFETSPDSVAITRARDGMFVSVNKGFEQITGYLREEVIGKTSLEVNIWKDPEDRRKIVEGLQARGEVQNYEAPFLTREGEIFGMMSAVIIELNGEPHILNITRDITECRRAEAQLVEHHAMLTAILESAATPVFSLDRAYRYTSFNRAHATVMKALYGAEIEIGRCMLDYQAVLEDQAEARKNLDHALRGEQLIESAYSGAPGRARRYFEIAHNPIKDAAGEVIGVSVFVSDLTKRKQAQEQLAASEVRYRRLFEAARDGILILDGETGVVMDVNPFLVEMLGFPQEEICGKELWELGFLKDIAANKENFLELQREKFIHYEGLPMETADGHSISVEFVSHAYQVDQRKVIQCNIRDITERKQAEDVLRISEKNLRESQRIAHIGNWSLNVATNQVVWSEELYKMYGFDPAIPVPPYTEHMKLFTPESWERLSTALANTRETGVPYELELETVRKDGSSGWMWVRGEAEVDPKGKIVGLWGAAQDITERKRVEEQLRRSEANLKQAQRVAHVGSWVWRTQENRLEWSDEMYRIFGIEKEKFSGSLSDVLARAIHPDDRAAVERSNRSVIEDRKPIPLEYRVVWPNGVIRTVWAEAGELNLDEAGNLETLTGIVQDITERKQADEALRESEERLRLSLHAANQGMYDLNIQTGDTIVNKEYALMLGYDPETFVETNAAWIERLHPNDKDTTAKAYTDYINGVTSEYRVEFRQKTRDGDWKWILSLGKIVEFDASGKPLRMLGTHTDITERKQANEKLANSEVRYRRLFEAARDGILILEAETGVVTDVNPFLVEMLSIPQEEIVGKELWELGFFKDIAANKANFLELQQKEYIRYEDLPLETTDGRKFYVEFVSNVYQVDHHKVVQCNIRDITERKRVEQQLAQYTGHLEEMVDERTRKLHTAHEQLVRQERLAMLGQVAGSIGHELRNPLGVISNAIYFLKIAQPDANDKIKEYLDIIENETRTSDKIITDLLDFTRIKSVEHEAASVSELIGQTLEHYPAPPSVEVILDLPANLPPVYADLQQIVQVLGNLTINACQAMNNSGQLTLSASAQGDMIAIAVQDSGEGIPPANMSKLFEPLFTTKTKGIGLGLPVSKKLAEANGGWIEVQSEPGKGSTFTLFLPIYSS